MKKEKFEQKLKKILSEKNVKVISFDVFDTILTRVVPSDLVVSLAAEKLSLYLSDFLGNEIAKEHILNSRAKFVEEIKEVELSEWMLSEWLDFFSNEYGLEPDIIKEFGVKSEIEAELSGLKSAKYLISVIELLKSKGFILIATSDMWLDSNQIKIILNHFGINFDYVFTSGEEKVSKAEGKLYKRIKNKINIKGNFLHIGDNLISDFINPKFYGYNSIWLPKKHPFLNFWIPKVFWKWGLKYSSDKVLISLLKSNKKNSVDKPVASTAYKNLGPMLTLFCFIQHFHIKQYNVKTAFFLARDGMLPYLVYKKMGVFFPDSADGHYIRVSRKSIALLYPDNLFMNVEFLPGKTGREYLGEWLSNFAISKELKNQILKKADLKENDKFTSDVRKRLKNELKFFKKEIEAEINILKTNIKDYLTQHVNGKEKLGNIALVDSGWAGTIQDCIDQVLGNDEKNVGLYLGVSAQGQAPSEKAIKIGILRDDYRNCKYHNILDSTAGAIRVWEIILREPEESVKGYKRNNNNIVEPVLDSKMTISMKDRELFDLISVQVLKKIEDSKTEIKIIKDFMNCFSQSDFEKAACFFSKKITIFPDRNFARKIIDLDFDEGSADGKKTSIGVKGLFKGMTWYSGIYSSIVKY
ncbi:MAG: HAD-IA family hydrolase [Candidatus Muiribacteriota bacterium]